MFQLVSKSKYLRNKNKFFLEKKSLGATLSCLNFFQIPNRIVTRYENVLENVLDNVFLKMFEFLRRAEKICEYL